MCFAYYLILNTIIFLPAYVINRKNTTFFPIQIVTAPVSLKSIIANVIRRYNFDMFRCCADFALLVIIIYLTKAILPKPIALIVMLSYLVFAIIHQTYYHSIKFIYNTEPLLINDWILIRRGLSIVFQAYRFYLIIGIFVLALLGYGLYLLCAAFLNTVYFQKEISIFWLVLLLVIFLLGLYSEIRYKNFKSIYGVLCFILPTYKFIQNIKNSFAERENLQAIKSINFASCNKVNSLNLNIKKNIIFIAVESYGAVFYDENRFTNTANFIHLIENQLNKKGWHMASQYSTSPIMGGASWLSYSTLLKGIHIASESMYSYLFKDDDHLAYEPLMQKLQHTGYDTWFISSIGGFEKMKIPWQKTLQFLGIEKVIKYKDLAYNGKHFGFGPSPPDQYSLNKAYQIIKEQSNNKPFAAFWLSLNSHYPWDSPEQIVADWNELNGLNEPYGISKNLLNSIKYEKAMQYQLNYLSDFILNNGTPNDIFILVGDHQPFNIGEIDNRLTPIHIICKDEHLTNNFKAFDFVQGITPKHNEEKYINHAGVQSMLIQVLNTCYGSVLEKTTYYPNGINRNTRIIPSII